jgi:hypothetical protein
LEDSSFANYTDSDLENFLQSSSLLHYCPKLKTIYEEKKTTNATLSIRAFMEEMFMFSNPLFANPSMSAEELAERELLILEACIPLTVSHEREKLLGSSISLNDFVLNILLSID